MKKLSAIMIACLLAFAAAFSAFAAGINENEQAVLDELSGTIDMNGNAMSIPSEFTNSMENYFNTIDMTAEQSAQIITLLQQNEVFLTNSGASNIDDLTFEQKQTLLENGKGIVAVVGLTMSYDTSTKVLTISDASGSAVFAATPTLVSASSSGSGSTSTNSGSGSTSTNSGSSSTAAVSDSTVIKTTGSSMNVGSLAMLGGAALVLVAGGAFYLIKTKKERA